MCVPVCSVRGSKKRRNQKVFLASNKNERKIVWKKLNRRLIFADESNGSACERDGERESRCIDWNAHPRSYKLLIIIMKPKKRTEKFAWIKFLRNQFDVGPELRDEHEWWKIFFYFVFLLVSWMKPQSYSLHCQRLSIVILPSSSNGQFTNRTASIIQWCGSSSRLSPV